MTFLQLSNPFKNISYTRLQQEIWEAHLMISPGLSITSDMDNAISTLVGAAGDSARWSAQGTHPCPHHWSLPLRELATHLPGLQQPSEAPWFVLAQGGTGNSSPREGLCQAGWRQGADGQTALWGVAGTHWALVHFASAGFVTPFLTSKFSKLIWNPQSC